MSRITVQTHITLDGVIESPPEALVPYMSDEGRQATLDLALACDALLLGRETWQHLGPMWREQTGPMAERLNAMPKYVVSATLDSADAWGGSTVVPYGEVAGLRARLDLLSYGCGALARDLLRDGLLDELHLNITPVVAGRGRRLLDEPAELLALDLVDSRTYPGGAVHLVCGPQGGPARHNQVVMMGSERGAPRDVSPREGEPVVDVVQQGPFFHGTVADLRPGELLTAGRPSNYRPEIVMNHVYFTARLDGAGLAAEIAAELPPGSPEPRVYRVEPTGPFEDDPNVTDKKFPGNPTRSFRSTAPLRVIAEETAWTRLTPEALQEWRERLAALLDDPRAEIIN